MKCRKCGAEMIKEKSSLRLTFKKWLQYLFAIAVLCVLLAITNSKIVEVITVACIGCFGLWCFVTFFAHIGGTIERYKCHKCGYQKQKVLKGDFIFDVITDLITDLF